MAWVDWEVYRRFSKTLRWIGVPGLRALVLTYLAGGEDFVWPSEVRKIARLGSYVDYIKRLAEHGLAEVDGMQCRLTEKGRRLAEALLTLAEVLPTPDT